MVKRILVVDDYPTVTLALKLAFRIDGRFELTGSAATAAEGLAQLEEPPDAVLLDLHLPDMEGVALVRAFRERARSTPLVLHSAADDTPEINEVRDLVDAVVPKSNTDDVVATLARLTGA